MTTCNGDTATTRTDWKAMYTKAQATLEAKERELKSTLQTEREKQEVVVKQMEERLKEKDERLKDKDQEIQRLRDELKDYKKETKDSLSEHTKWLEKNANENKSDARQMYQQTNQSHLQTVEILQKNTEQITQQQQWHQQSITQAYQQAQQQTQQMTQQMLRLQSQTIQQALRPAKRLLALPAPTQEHCRKRAHEKVQEELIEFRKRNKGTAEPTLQEQDRVKQRYELGEQIREELKIVPSDQQTAYLLEQAKQFRVSIEESGKVLGELQCTNAQHTDLPTLRKTLQDHLTHYEAYTWFLSQRGSPSPPPFTNLAMYQQLTEGQCTLYQTWKQLQQQLLLSSSSSVAPNIIPLSTSTTNSSVSASSSSSSSTTTPTNLIVSS